MMINAQNVCLLLISSIARGEFNRVEQLSALRERAQEADAKLWDPEKQFPSGATWGSMVSMELQRSLSFYPKIDTLDKAIQHLDQIMHCVNLLIMVIEGRLFVSLQHHALHKHKPQDYLSMIKTAVQRVEEAGRTTGQRYPNVAYLFEEMATGREGSTRCINTNYEKTTPKSEQLPYVVMAKYGGYNQPGILVPNPYFANLTTWNYLQKIIEKSSKEHPWTSRDPRCVWRGAVTHKLTCDSDFGNWARFCVVAQSSKRSDLLDAKAVAKLRPRDPYLNPNDPACRALPYDKEMYQLFSLVANTTSTQGQATAKYFAKYLPFANFTQYRLLLSLPGVMGGSYSRHLNKLWNMGGVLALWNSPHVEWYYPALRHGHTHIGVDCHTIIDQLAYFQDPENQDKLETLRKNARRVYEEFLSADGLARYMTEAMEALSRRSGQHLILNDPRTRDKVLRQIGCSDLDLVEVHTTGFVNFTIDGMPDIDQKEEHPGRGKYYFKLIARDDPVLGACAQPDAKADAALQAKSAMVGGQ